MCCSDPVFFIGGKYIAFLLSTKYIDNIFN
jgi:hypothetical protein